MGYCRGARWAEIGVFTGLTWWLGCGVKKGESITRENNLKKRAGQVVAHHGRPNHHTNLIREVHVMAEEHPNTTGQEKEETKISYGFGPKTERAVSEKLNMIVALAFLGHKAFEEHEAPWRVWQNDLTKAGYPYSIEYLMENAFESFLLLASQAVNELFEPKDSVKGKLIDRTGPGGARDASQ